MSNTEMSDETLLQELFTNVNRLSNAAYVRGWDDFQVLARLGDIFERVSQDGIAQHPLFKPIAKAMSSLSEHQLKDDEAVASALFDMANNSSSSSNPWNNFSENGENEIEQPSRNEKPPSGYEW